MTIAAAVGYAFAGSSNTLAHGTKIGGFDVGGLTAGSARSMLERKAAKLANVPVEFRANGRTWKIRPFELGVTGDWRGAVNTARNDAGGIAFVRGYKRLALRVFPEDVEVRARAYDAAVAYKVGLLAQEIDRPARDAKLVKHGLEIDIARGQDGAVLDQRAARRVIVRALADLARAPVTLPVRTMRPKHTVADFRRARAIDRRVVSAPVTLVLDGKRRELAPRQLASMLLLQEEPTAKLALGGPVANAYFAKLDRTVSHPAQNASFSVDGPNVTITPSRPGIGLDVARSSAAVLSAATRRTSRVARLIVGKVEPQRTTEEARAMGITGLVGSYETVYGGIANRIHNVRLVAHLVDDTLIPPGAEFSFNETTGERTAAKGFLEAPVIINGELQTGLGGGVCQVSTTVFNAAYEAGLSITSRTNHALYISHYPLGRDATVDYPGIDLKFENDTGHWLLLRTFVGSSSLVVSLYGTPQNRRVVSEASPLRVTTPQHEERKLDKSLPPGTEVVDSPGVPGQATSVRRRVYEADGRLLYDSVWYSTYRWEPRLVRYGPDKPKKPKTPKKAQGTSQAAGTPGQTAPGATAPTPTTPEPGVPVPPRKPQQ